MLREDVFSSVRSLFILFRPFDPNDLDSADVMVVGTREGNIHLSIYDSFVIGSFKCPLVLREGSAYLFRHASHESYSTHALLMRPISSENTLYFMPMDLRFMSASSDYLSILSSRSTHLHNLLRYIQHAQSLMMAEWRGTQELPSKFLRNINESLDDTSNGDIVQALYHSVATGHTFPTVRDWLVDELTERVRLHSIGGTPLLISIGPQKMGQSSCLWIRKYETDPARKHVTCIRALFCYTKSILRYCQIPGL